MSKRLSFSFLANTDLQETQICKFVQICICTSLFVPAAKLGSKRQDVLKGPEIMMGSSRPVSKHILIICKSSFGSIFEVNMPERFIAEPGFDPCAITCNVKAVIDVLSEHCHIGSRDHRPRTRFHYTVKQMLVVL